MFHDFKSPSFIIGVSILLLVPFGLGGIVYSSLRNDDAQQQAGGDSSSSEERPFEELARESNIPPAAVSSPDNSGSGASSNPSPGIPIGKYSNPPTSITTGGYDSPSNTPSEVDSGFEGSSSGISSNPALPDYAAPNSSNNFNRNHDRSLVTPLEANETLESPTRTFDSPPPLAPTAETLFQP